MIKMLLILMAAMPLRVSRFAGRMIGWISYYGNARIKKVALANLKLCFPDMSDENRRALTRQSLIHTGQTLMETPAVWLSQISRTSKWILRIENETLLDEAQQRGKGVLVLLPHQGNWEMYNVYAASNNKHMTALYRPPDQVYLQGLMRDIREGYGNELVPTNVKGIATLYRRLKAGGLVTVLPDQVPSSGQYAKFYGEDAFTDSLTSRIIKKTGAAVVCCTVYREANGFVVSFSTVDDELYSDVISDSLLALNRTIEVSIKNHLEQYQWSYKRFRKRPKGKEKIYRFSNLGDKFHS